MNIPACIRKHIKLTQAQGARLAGGGNSACSRYERVSQNPLPTFEVSSQLGSSFKYSSNLTCFPT